MKNGKMTLKLTAALAMLSAISIILGKYLAISGGEVLRFSLENLPIIFAGAAFGPVAGALVGAVADLVGCLMVGYTINPVVTAGAITIGVMSGGVWKICKKFSLPTWASCALAVTMSHIAGSVMIKTVGLAAYYDMHIGILMLWRLFNYIIVGGIEGALLFYLMKNKMITEAILSITGKGGKR